MGMLRAAYPRAPRVQQLSYPARVKSGACPAGAGLRTSGGRTQQGLGLAGDGPPSFSKAAKAQALLVAINSADVAIDLRVCADT